MRDPERGPFPLPSAIDDVLKEPHRQVLEYLRDNELPTDAIVPLVAHIVVPRGPEDIPAMFARATDSDSAPLTIHMQPKGVVSSTRTMHVGYPGRLCLLPSPLKIGLRAVAIHQGGAHREDWSLSRLMMLAPNPRHIPLLAEPTHPIFEHHSIGHSTDLLTDIPELTPDKALQARLGKQVLEMVTSCPHSFDKIEELVPGITCVFPRDGNSLRENHDSLSAYDFVTAATSMGLNSSIGKGLYGRLLSHIGNRGLEVLKKRLNADNYHAVTSITESRISETRKRAGDAIISDRTFKKEWMELLLDRDMVRDITQQLQQGSVDLGLTPNMLRILSAMFDF